MGREVAQHDTEHGFKLVVLVCGRDQRGHDGSFTLGNRIVVLNDGLFPLSHFGLESLLLSVRECEVNLDLV